MVQTDKYRKVYVTMNIRVSPDGSIRPTSLIWEDGRKYRIDRVIHVTPAAATKVGGRGMRYTVVVEGRERNFFDDEGRWFTEAPVYGS